MFSRTKKIYIVSEVHPQHGGDMRTLETMIIQCKMAGADAIKVQYYNSNKLFGDNRKLFAQLNKDEMYHLENYCNNIGIDFFASVFDVETLSFVIERNYPYIKISSRSIDNTELCGLALESNIKVLMSNGFDNKKFPYNHKNLYYLYCVSDYPCLLEKLDIPNFDQSKYFGYSCHAPGLTPAKTAVIKGARIIEKHFTLSNNLQSGHEKGHFGSMDFDMLKDLRTFCDEFIQMDSQC